MGSLRSMAKDIMPPGMVPDDDYYEEDDEQGSLFDHHPSTIDTAAATTRGSDVPLAPRAGLGGLAMNPDAGHSTVVIRAPPGAPEDAPSLMTDAGSDETAETRAPVTPSQSTDSVDAAEPPPAYTGSVRGATRRSSYAARQNVTTGTVLGAADLGTGVDTIRPVKKVDTIRSLRLSEEYVGSLRSREGSAGGGSIGSAPSSPQSAKGSSKRGPSEAQKAGKALVDEVVLPTLQRVSASGGCTPFVC